jgi:excisionase family DNA binding protein
MARREAPMSEDKWLTVEQIAEQIQVTEQTVRRWLRAGALAGRNFSGRTGYRVRQSDLDTFLASDSQAKKAAA